MARFEEFWRLACDFKDFLRVAFMFFMFLFVLSVISLFLAQPGTGSYAIAIINFVMVSVFTLLAAYMSRVCSKRERKYY